ncbi:hypothetical protein Sango_1197900 [Sesamum angolense]|uniref:Peptidase C45 hydrolase domain-containing protein n=1 Tax=Sesamum angolense TaxID=2727404 RepID=A0AAE1WX39_9LAMI|nr:hypothetical protein Sango_1197900 [Sesamum angolense]
MESIITGRITGLEMLEIGPCKDSYEMGFLIGQRFSRQINSRLAKDLILRNQLLPFAHSPHSHSLLKSLSENNMRRYPNYWDELQGTAQGSGVPFLEIMLLNFRKEILPFIPKAEESSSIDTNDDCSDILVVSDSMAVAAHNEDANIALVGHTYLIKGNLPNGSSFTAYTYAGELPSCAFGFNSHGLIPAGVHAESVPPSKHEIDAGAIGRNFICRDLLEAQSIDDALTENDENSLSRQKRAVVLPKASRKDLLLLLGDRNDSKYPIYMGGPLLYTLCTVVVNLDEKTLSIIEGDPKETQPSLSSPCPDLVCMMELERLHSYHDY